MNNPNAVFDPLLTESYAQQLTENQSAILAENLQPQQLLYLLNHSNQNPQIQLRGFDLITQNLLQIKQDYASYFNTIRDSKKAGVGRVLDIPSIDREHESTANLTILLKHTAGIQLTQPHWLKNIPQSYSSQATLGLQILSIYKELTATGKNGSNLTDSFCSLLLSTGVQRQNLFNECEKQSNDSIAEIDTFASIQCALSQFPRVFFAEILGFSLACCSMPSLIEICFPDQPLSAEYCKQRNNCFEKQISPLEQCISTYLALFSDQKETIWQRLQQGFWLYNHQMLDCRNQLEPLFTSSKSFSIEMIDLIVKKAQAAKGHHQNIQLQGQPLDNWFLGLPENGHQLLEALKQSKYIDREIPENSLILKLFEFNGPMFGVLEKSEFAVLKNWLRYGLNEEPEAGTLDREKTDRAKTKVKIVSHRQFQVNNDYAKLKNRELYYYLINADFYPDVLATAKGKVIRLLGTCCLFNALPFKHYSHQQFDDYILQIYQQEMNAYKPLKGKPSISKAAYIWGFEQIAPMILIDGCWLQKSLDIQHSHSQVSEILFSIYGDELGNGQLEQNHPYIFQQLLDSLSINVPAVYEKQFVQHDGFIDSAFDLPVYMLSLSNHSIEFLPELLGLNMAIELSGLGKHYMRLVDDWNYWNIDPTIAKTHISIDSFASGHTFLAKKAIQIYLDEILLKTADVKALDQHWRRIYTGYSSLRFVASRFKYAVPMGYFLNKYNKNNKKSGL